MLLDWRLIATPRTNADESRDRPHNPLTYPNNPATQTFAPQLPGHRPTYLQLPLQSRQPQKCVRTVSKSACALASTLLSSYSPAFSALVPTDCVAGSIA